MRSLAELYAQRCMTPSDIVEHLPTLYETVVAENAQVVVELGVRSGNSTAALLAAVEVTGGHLWSVDTRLMPQEPFEQFRRAGGPLWSFLIGDDLALADQVGRQIEATTIGDAHPSYVSGGIDVLFIDTSHAYEHTLAELHLYGPRSKVILLHDTELEFPEGIPPEEPYPVKRAVEQYVADTGRSAEFRTNCFGLGVVR